MSKTHSYQTRYQERNRMAEDKDDVPSRNDDHVSLDESMDPESSPKPPQRCPKNAFQQGLAQGKAFGFTGADLQKLRGRISKEDGRKRRETLGC